MNTIISDLTKDTNLIEKTLYYNNQEQLTKIINSQEDTESEKKPEDVCDIETLTKLRSHDGNKEKLDIKSRRCLRSLIVHSESTVNILPKVTLKKGLESIVINNGKEIPWIIRLLENPSSSIALPGKISLYNHDCLHVLLNKGVSPKEEAFLIGFTMGNVKTCNWLVVRIFKFFSKYIYPGKFKFTNEDLEEYDRGYELGVKYRKNITFNLINFKDYENYTVGELREMFL